MGTLWEGATSRGTMCRWTVRPKGCTGRGRTQRDAPERRRPHGPQATAPTRHTAQEGPCSPLVPPGADSKQHLERDPSRLRAADLMPAAAHHCNRPQGTTSSPSAPTALNPLPPWGRQLMTRAIHAAPFGSLSRLLNWQIEQQPANHLDPWANHLDPWAGITPLTACGLALAGRDALEGGEPPPLHHTMASCQPPPPPSRTPAYAQPLSP